MLELEASSQKHRNNKLVMNSRCEVKSMIVYRTLTKYIAKKETGRTSTVPSRIVTTNNDVKDTAAADTLKSSLLSLSVRNRPTTQHGRRSFKIPDAVTAHVLEGNATTIPPYCDATNR